MKGNDYHPEDELWDIYDKDRNLTGKTHRRGDPMQEGDYHLVVHVCIFNSKKQLLIQQRQPFKESWPNMWDLTVGGSAISGDSSCKAAEREVKEELGIDIDLSNCRPYFTINFAQGFDDYYLITQDVNLHDLTLQEEEVKRVKWVNQDEFLYMQENGTLIPYFFGEKLFSLYAQKQSRIVRRKNYRIQHATPLNLASWMSLVEIARDEFPGLETPKLLAAHEKVVRKNIGTHTAICALGGNMVIGALLYSLADNSISFLVVHPHYRRQQVASKMYQMMLKQLNVKRDISVDTYSKKDARAAAAHGFYKKLGFKEQGSVTTHGNYNGERMVLSKKSE